MAKVKDLIAIAFIILLICSFTIFFTFYYYSQENKCQANPLVYGAKKYLDGSNADFVHGQLQFFKEGSNGLSLQFNDKKIEVRQESPAEKINFSNEIGLLK